MKLFKKKSKKLKIYCDVDDTLLIWDYPTYINQPLVDILEQGLKENLFEVIIWSGTGKNWAKKYSRELFPKYNLKAYSKQNMYNKIPKGCFAIDDRLKEERYYLKKFDKVFLPYKFIEYVKNNKLIKYVK